MSQISDFFASLKDDLLGRRLLPVLLVLGVALLAAVAYAVLGGGSSASTSTVAASSPSSQAAGVAVSQAPANPDRPVAETTSGASKQRGGSARDPFTPLPGAQTASSAGASQASGSSATKSSSGSASTPSSAGGTTPTSKETTPAKPKKVYVHYHVTAQFGVVPPSAEGAPPQAAQLKTYRNMALDEPLPDKANPQLVFMGVVLSTGKDVVFALTGAAILHGSATCKPSPTQCQGIELQVGQSETLEVVEPSGSLVTYELKLLSITKSISTASTARVHSAFRTESKAGRELLRRDGVHPLSGLRYSQQRGGLVFAGHPAFGARAHAAKRRHRR